MENFPKKGLPNLEESKRAPGPVTILIVNNIMIIMIIMMIMIVIIIIILIFKNIDFDKKGNTSFIYNGQNRAALFS